MIIEVVDWARSSPVCKRHPLTLLLPCALMLGSVFLYGQRSDTQSAPERSTITSPSSDDSAPWERRSQSSSDRERSEDQLSTRDRQSLQDRLPLSEGEEMDEDYGDTGDMSAAATARRVALPADRIIGILQEQPEMLDAMKRLLLTRMQQQGTGYAEQGQWLDEGAITDDALFSRIEQDPDLRVALTQELRKRGLTNEPELDASQGMDNAREFDAGGRATTYNRRLRSRVTAPSTRRREEEIDVTKMVRRPNPYPSLPSLKDLYAQYPALDAKVKRFGRDVFRNGSGNADRLPMDLPAGPDYVLGPGDRLTLNLWGSVSRRLPLTVDRQGQITLPEAGPLTVAGLNIAQAQEAIQKALSAQFHTINSEISLARLRTVRIYVVGDVQRPGAYDISSLSTPLNALYAAGGPTARGSLRTVHHYRGKQLVREVDLYDFLLRGTGAEFERLQSGDTIQVPPTGPQVTVTGMVKRPAIYELKGQQSLQDVLSLAGGVLVSANMRQVTVERVEAHERRTMLNVKLPQEHGPDAVAEVLGSFMVQDGDRVVIAPILPYNEGAVYLQGHVFRPGKYAYRDGITISDLVRSYQDVLPEPADHAEIIRLQPPDFRPTTISFNLSEVLTGEDPITLQPFDVVRLFSRYEIDAPKVFIYGEVLRPGEYPLARGMTAAGLVQMAGGFKRSAFRDQADVSSYVIQDGKRVLTKHTAVEIGNAVQGDKAADVALKPGDVVTIRQLTGWKDVGAAVVLKGEVRYPGTYGIREGERLSAVLKRAGGFPDSAYPAGAVLERVQVREMAEKNRLELIARLETAGVNVKPGSMSGQEQAAIMQAMQQQQQQVLASLRSHPASGRLVIRISADISKWEGTAADIPMRAGDVLLIPKKPTFVLVNGQVYNPAAITFTPGKTADWYLRQAGGPTQMANRKSIFIVHADGSVSGGGSSGGWWKGSALNARLQPGDTVVVPEKVIGGSALWKNIVSSAQVLSAVATSAALAANL